jgi:hypothetical protein
MTDYVICHCQCDKSAKEREHKQNGGLRQVTDQNGNYLDGDEKHFDRDPTKMNCTTEIK